MSSLTSVGVNKNKKGFAPKLSKRKDRKERKSTTASTSAKATTDNSLTTEAPGPSIAEPASTSTFTSTIIDNDVVAPPPSTSNRTRIAVKVQSTSISVEESTSAIDSKSEYLTKEEIAINAAAATRKRRRVSKEEPDDDMPSISQSHSIKAPSPVREISPSDITDRPHCNFDQLLLKVESVAQDSKESLSQVDMEPQQLDPKGNIEEHVRVRKESVAPKVDNNVPKMDVSDDVNYTELLADGEDDDVDVDGDVPVERLMPVYIDVGQTNPNATPVNADEISTRPASRRQSARSSKLIASDRLKGAGYISGANDDDDQYQADEADEVEQPKKKKLKPLKPKGKGKEREKPAAKSKSKGSKKGAGTAISIGIGIPSASTSTPITPGESAEASSEEEEYSDVDSDGNRIVKTRKKKRRGYKRSHRFDYRLVENLRTLDDITNDPAPAENLERPMFEFTKDIDGIVSKTFKEMEVLRSEARKKDEAKSKMSKEELEALKIKEAEEERAAKAKRDAAKAKEDERRRRELDGQVLAESSNALQVRLVNGEIVLDTDSLVVERTEGDVNYGDDPMEVVEENSMTRKVNSNTYSKRKQSSRWDDFETALFYDCLSQFGTDFEMIANMMPGRTRNQIRMKFNREEKLCPEKVTEYMISKRKPMDLEKYKEMSGIELEAVPDDFHEMQLA